MKIAKDMTGAGLRIFDPRFGATGTLVLRTLFYLSPSLRESLLFGRSRICVPLQKVVQRSLAGPVAVRVQFIEGRLASFVFDCLSSEKYFMLGNKFEHKVQSVLQEMVRPGDIVYDVGANVGYMSLLLSALCGRAGRVVSFEPSPVNGRRFKRNIESNRIANIELQTVAASDTESTGLLSEKGSESQIISGESAPCNMCSRVSMIRLDDFVYRDHHAPPAFIKLDVEGHAGHCLRGMKAILQKARPSVLCELHNPGESGEVLGIFAEYGYETATIDSPGKFPRRIIAKPRQALGSQIKAGRAADRTSASPDFPSLSAIIPTKDRPSDVELAVRSLLHQTTSPQQVIIVDQSQNEEARRRVELQHAEAPPQVRNSVKFDYIRVVDVASLAIARNRAMRIAEGDIWLFLDDDVCLEPKFLEEILAVYLRYPRVSGVSGIITNYRPTSRIVRLWTTTFVRGPFHDDRQPIYWNADRLRYRDAIPVSRLGGGLMSFRAADIRGLDFDENLRGVSDGEDVEFCNRLKAGTILVVAPRARLNHKQSPIGRSPDHHLRRDARSVHYLYWKDWNRGLKNRLCFAWLNVGYALMATLACVWRHSLEPWQALLAGVRDAKEVTLRGAALENSSAQQGSRERSSSHS